MDIPEQIQYQGSAQSVGFNPVAITSPTEAIARNQAGQLESLKAALAMEDANLKRVSDVNISNQKYNVAALSKFSQTLTDTLVKETEKKNERDMQEGLNAAYMDGFSPEAIAEYDLKETELKLADEGIQQYADTVSKAGAPFMGVQQVRQLSGWKQYGYAMGMAQMAGSNYESAMASALAGLPPGASVAEKAAALAQARGEYMRQTGLLGINPLLSNKYAFPAMRQADSKLISEWRKQEVEEQVQTMKDEALQVFFADPAGTFGQSIIALERAGMTKGAARDYLLEQIQDPNLIDQIASQTSWDGKLTWQQKHPGVFRDARLKAMKRSQDNFNTYEADIAIDKKQTLDGILGELQDKPHTNEQLEQIIEGWKAKYDTTIVPKELLDYQANFTLQARDQKEQEEELLDKIASNTLTTEELMSGRYSRDLVIKYRSTAQGIDKDYGAGGQVAKASQYHIASVENAVRRSIGLVDRNSILPPSAQLAMGAAMQQLESGARKLKAANPNMTWEQAYSQSALGLVQEIENEQGQYERLKGPDGRPLMGSKAGFTQFSGANIKAHDLTAMRTREWNEAINTKGQAVFTAEGGLFSQREIELMANDKGADLSKLSLIVSQYNAKNPTAPITLGGAKQQLLDSAGVQPQKPYKVDEYEQTALSAGMVDLLTRPTPSRINRVSSQGNLIPGTIRTGVQGSQDVMQAAVAFGMPPQIAPLAAMQWALESGWGQYNSGRNNAFGIKGAGTTVATKEDYGNGLVNTTASFRDYNSPQESVKDYVDLLRDPRYAAVLAAQTPAEALRAVKAAGYATDSQYVSKGLSIFRQMGINPNVPYQAQPLTASPWSNPALMGTAARKFITGNTGIGTGAHLDMRVYDPSVGDYIDPTNYQDLLVTDGGIPIRRKFAMTSGYGPRRAPVPGASTFHRGIDFATPVGTAISVRGGRYTRSWWDNGGGGVVTAYRLPDGKEMRLLHGSKQNM